MNSKAERTLVVRALVVGVSTLRLSLQYSTANKLLALCYNHSLAIVHLFERVYVVILVPWQMLCKNKHFLPTFIV